MKILRFSIALVSSVMISSLLNSAAWPIVFFWRTMIIYSFFSLIFALFIGLPIYSYLVSKNNAHILNSVFFIAFVYSAVYFLLRFALSLSINVESINGLKVVSDGFFTLYGLAAVLVSSLNVFLIGCFSNLAFWFVFARSFKRFS